jgi:hypothetical protein
LPSQLSGLWIDRFLQRHVAFMDSDYRLSRLVLQRDGGLRKGVDSPYDVPWKLSESFDGRQYFLWDRIESDPYLRAHAIHVWLRRSADKPIPPDARARTIAQTAAAVRRIRARGGEVIFVRPPSIGKLRVDEERRMPRAAGWDRLLVGAGAKGVHADDLPAAQGLVLPELSHLSRACATVFTDILVRRLAELTPRLKLRPGAPPPLGREDCVPGRDGGTTPQ